MRPFLPAVLVLATCLAPPARAEEPASPEFLVETADGTILEGTLPPGLAFVIVQPDGEIRVDAASVRRMAVSGVREPEARELEAAVRRIGERWKSDSYAEREAATKEAAKLPAAAAQFLAELGADEDAEVRARSREVVSAIEARGDLSDARDLVEVEDRILRGWLKLEAITLTTSLGPVSIGLAEVRALRRETLPPVPRRPPAAGEWPPPPPERNPPPPARGSLPAVVLLRNGWRIVGEVASAALPLQDDGGARIATDDLLFISRARDDRRFFRAARKGAPAVTVTLAAKEVPVDSTGRRWDLAADEIESIEFGPLRRRTGSLADLVRDFQAAKAAGGGRPAQKFWVHIRDQRANPWDSADKMGLTWSLLDVKGDACLVGVHPKSNAYQGDTSIDEELPILAIRKQTLAAPQGLDVSSPYAGWAGSEIRLTRPVRGKELVSLAAANELVEAEFGKGWRMAQFHDTNTMGWNWWAYWAEQKQK